MNKIICEICGTVYPDNASLCPICGYPRNTKDYSNTTQEHSASAVQSSEHVRGGRFSNSNVKKRNQPSNVQHRPRDRRASGQEWDRLESRTKPQRSENRGLVITVIVLLIAVILLGAYIGIRFFRGADAYDRAAATATAPPTTPSEETEPEHTDVICTDIQLGAIDLTEGIEFRGMGRGWRLNVSLVPENTTEELIAMSSNESVATVGVVDNELEVLSVGPGTAEITVTCGTVFKTFPVQCSFDDSTGETTEATEATEETTEPTETTQEDESSGDFVLNRKDITFSKMNESFTFKAGSISNSDITWSSSDESIVTITNGKATAVGNGTVTITATYNGEKATCIIRCVLPAAQTTPTEPTEETEATEETEETEATEATEDTQGTEATEATEAE